MLYAFSIVSGYRKDLVLLAKYEMVGVISSGCPQPGTTQNIENESRTGCQRAKRSFEVMHHTIYIRWRVDLLQVSTSVCF